MALTFMMVTLLNGGNDVIATHFSLSINQITWMSRIGVLLLPLGLSRGSDVRSGSGLGSSGGGGAVWRCLRLVVWVIGVVVVSKSDGSVEEFGEG